jgi:hypothetical protein
MIHSSMTLYLSVPRNISGLYSSVPALRNVAWYIHRLTDEYTSVNRQMYLAVLDVCHDFVLASTPSLPAHHTVPLSHFKKKFNLLSLPPLPTLRSHPTATTTAAIPVPITGPAPRHPLAPVPPPPGSAPPRASTARPHAGPPPRVTRRCLHATLAPGASNRPPPPLPNPSATGPRSQTPLPLAPSIFRHG